MESAVMRAQACFDGLEPFDTMPLKAASMCCGLIENHGFVDGNKRIGIATLCLILRKNDLSIDYTQSELVALGLAIARGEMNVRTVADWVEAHITES